MMPPTSRSEHGGLAAFALNEGSTPGVCEQDERTSECPRVLVCDQMEMEMAPSHRAFSLDPTNQGLWSDLPEEAFRDNE